MKKIILALSAFLITASAFSQKDIKVTSRGYQVEKIDREGLSTVLELDKKFVKKKWEKFIKEYGKVESKKNLMLVNVAQINAISSNPVKLSSAVESSGKGTMVWMAIDMGTEYVVAGGKGYAAAENILKDFAKSCYKADVVEQLEEAQKAFDAASKKESKVIKEGEKLSSDLESNAKQKIKLENDIQNNAKEKVQLEKDISQNTKDQSSAKQEVGKMQKALDIKKAELEKFN